MDTPDHFMEKIIGIWGKKGYSEFYETIWTSSLKHKYLGKVRTFLANNNYENIDISIVIPPHDDTFRLKWIKYYDIDGNCISTNRDITIPAQSNNLKITSCYKDEKDRSEGISHHMQTINTLRLIFGVPIARELILTRTFSINKSCPHIHSESGFASYFDTQTINLFETPPIEQAKTNKIPEAASILLSKSFEQTFPTERFVLLWLAFESMIDSLPGSGNNGDKRKRFFIDVLKSNLINDTVFKLFLLRCKLFKEGKTQEKTLEKACWFLYQVIQITILEKCPQRDEFAKGLELKITQEPFNL